MTGQDAILGLLGCYLTAGLVVSAWRAASGSAGGVGLWVVLFSAWMIFGVSHWVSLSGLKALPAGLAWTALCLLLVRVGVGLRGRGGLGHLVWLLGPVHALVLATAWLAAGRQRSAARGEAAYRRSGKEEVQEAFECVVELGEKTVGEVMVPRSEMASLEEGVRVLDWVAIVRETRHRCIPVYRGDLDEILGYLRLKDLFKGPDPSAEIQDYMREVRFVPESMRCDDLLRELISQGERIAIVVDEFGGTAGIVTDQDLVEILLGEISVENPFEGKIVRLGEGEYLADGHYRIDDFNEWAPTPLPEGDYETMAGLILERLGRIPPEGERIELDAMVLQVMDTTERKILKIRLWFLRDSPATESDRQADNAGVSVGHRGGPAPRRGGP